jgi:hypothetical protein
MIDVELCLLCNAEVKLESGCLKPETPEHGEMFVLWSGLLVQFRCKNDDYKLVGAAAVICRNRTWTQDPPVCVHHHQLEAHLASQQQHQQQSVGDNGESTFFFFFKNKRPKGEIE